MIRRADVLREAAIVVAQSREAPASVSYAIARELWHLWWTEVDAMKKAGDDSPAVAGDSA